MDFNSVTLIGRISQEPEMRSTGNGTPVANFSLAVNREQKGADGKPIADFFRCTAFGKTAENVHQYKHKGDEILVTGRVQNSKWTDQQGVTHYSTEVLVDRVKFGQTAAKNRPANGSSTAATGEPLPPMEEMEEVPF